MNTAYETIGLEAASKARRHACLFFETPGEQMAETLPFIREGLLADERCIFVTDECAADSWAAALRGYGVDVEQETTRGSLDIWPMSQWRTLREVNSILMARRVWEIVEGSVDRFTGLRIAVDMNWTLTPEIVPTGQLCHLEATLDYLYSSDLPLQVVCQYNRRSLPCATIHAGLRTHPIAIVERKTVINPFYDGPAILEHEPDLNECHGDSEIIEAMIAKLASCC